MRIHGNMGPYILFERSSTMNEETTFKEKLKKNKNVIIAFVAGGIIGSIIAKRIITRGSIVMVIF